MHYQSRNHLIFSGTKCLYLKTKHAFENCRGLSNFPPVAGLRTVKEERIERKSCNFNIRYSCNAFFIKHSADSTLQRESTLP